MLLWGKSSSTSSAPQRPKLKNEGERERVGNIVETMWAFIIPFPPRITEDLKADEDNLLKPIKAIPPSKHFQCLIDIIRLKHIG